MRVLHVLLYYWPHCTGLTIHVQRVAEAMARRGHTSTVLSARYNRQLPREEMVNGVRVVRLPAMLRISRGMVMPSFPWHAWRLIREHDLVNVHVPLLEASLVTTIARLQRHKPVVITHHGDLVLPVGWFNRFIEFVMFQMVYRTAARYASAVIAYSQDYAEHSKWLQPVMAKVRPVYPPVAIPRPEPAGVAAMRQQHGLQGKTIVGYAGRFVEEKRPDLLIQTVPYLVERFPDLRIVFAGEYRIRYEGFFDRCSALIEQYKDRLVFLGLIRDPRQMADFFALCDVLALPSGTECFGLVQAEAMLCGTPVVVSDTPGAREVVRVTGMGEIVPRGDVPALAEALARVLAGRERYLKPVEQIASTFGLEGTVDGYEAVYRQALEGGRLAQWRKDRGGHLLTSRRK